MAHIKHKREDILDVGINLFWENGYNTTGLNQIITEAQITKGTFYNYFSNKIDFAAKAINRYCDIAIATHITPYAEDETEKSHIKRIVNLYKHLIDIYGNKGCLRPQMTNELGGYDEEVDKVLIENKDTIVSILSELIDKGIEAGEIQETQLSAFKRARLIVTQFDGVLNQVRISKSNDIMQDFLTNLKMQLS